MGPYPRVPPGQARLIRQGRPATGIPPIIASQHELRCQVRVASLNVRNTADRWRQRRPLLVRQLAELAPDVIGLQELRRFPNQARSLTDPDDQDYRVHRAPKSGLLGLWEGIGVLSRLPVVDRASLDLGQQHRVALRVTLRLPGGRTLEIYNVHLASTGEAGRVLQVGRVLDWMATRPCPHQILLGDLNSRPASPSVELVTSRMRSAHVAVHGAEPASTAPTALRRGRTGPGAVLDYIFVSDALEVHDARLVFDQVDPADEHLAASDHYGLTATVSLSL